MLIKHMLYLQLDVILSCAAWKAKAECDMIFYFSFFYIVKKLQLRLHHHTANYTPFQDHFED